MKQHLTISITGFVQGVSFRYFAAKTAAKLNITGGVKNEPDGTVLIEAEGEEKDLEKFITWCSHGPPVASVEKVETKRGKLKNYSDFAIWF